MWDVCFLCLGFVSVVFGELYGCGCFCAFSLLAVRLFFWWWFFVYFSVCGWCFLCLVVFFFSGFCQFIFVGVKTIL